MTLDKWMQIHWQHLMLTWPRHRNINMEVLISSVGTKAQQRPGAQIQPVAVCCTWGLKKYLKKHKYEAQSNWITAEDKNVPEGKKSTSESTEYIWSSVRKCENTVTHMQNQHRQIVLCVHVCLHVYTSKGKINTFTSRDSADSHLCFGSSFRRSAWLVCQPRLKTNKKQGRFSNVLAMYLSCVKTQLDSAKLHVLQNVL